MKYKIQENSAKGRYANPSPNTPPNAYINIKGGWNDYLVSEQIIFSHRTNNYTAQNMPEDLHAHDYYELVICSGKEQMQYVTDGKILSVKPGTAILTKPLSMHMFRPTAPVVYDRYILYFKSSLKIFHENNILDFIKKGNNSYCIFHFKDNDDICSYASRCEQELSNSKSKYSDTKALLHICNIFLALSEAVTDNMEAYDNNIPQYLFEIKDYIDNEFTNITSIADLVNKFHYSREHITRNFHKCYNTTLYEYILRRKLIYCCSLLRQNFSVEKSATMSGFTNMSGFNRIFRKYNGCTPSEYKAKKHF